MASSGVLEHAFVVVKLMGVSALLPSPLSVCTLGVWFWSSAKRIPPCRLGSEKAFLACLGLSDVALPYWPDAFTIAVPTSLGSVESLSNTGVVIICPLGAPPSTVTGSRIGLCEQYAPQTASILSVILCNSAIAGTLMSLQQVVMLLSRALLGSTLLLVAAVSAQLGLPID